MPASCRLFVLLAFALLVPCSARAGDLFQAINNGDVAAVRRLLRQQPELVRKTDTYGNLPLQQALRGRNLDMVRALLDARADVRALDANVGITALHVTAGTGDREAAELLLARGADVNAQSKMDGLTPLHTAASSGNLDVARLLLARGADVEGGFDGKGVRPPHPPLNDAIRGGHLAVVRLLLSKGASVNRRGFRGDTPLQLAAEVGNARLVKLLLARGARIDSPAILMTALVGRKREVVDVLLAQRVDLSAPEYLVRACEVGARELVERLLGRGADVNAAQADGRTPLHAAAQSGAVDVVELLLRKRADVKAADRDGNTALHLVPQWSLPAFGPARPGWRSGRAIAELLLASGASPKEANKQGQRPAFLAAQRGDRPLLEYLADHGAELDCYTLAALGRVDALGKRLAKEKLPGSPGEYLYPPLHLAAQYGQAKAAALLVDRSADVNEAGPYGMTPLHLAAAAGQARVAALLLERGAKINAPMSRSLYVNAGATPLQLALHHGRVEVIRLLLSKNARPVLDRAAREQLLRQAVQNKQVRLVLWLETQGTPMDPKVFGVTALHLAAEVGDRAALEELLARGADLKAAGALAYETPLHHAVRRQDRDMVELLLARGADVNLNSPLTTAVQTGNVELAALLIRKGAKTKAWQGLSSPLSAACQGGNVEMVKLLLDHGADLKQAPADALHLAALEGHTGVIELLLERGADVKAPLRPGVPLYFKLMQHPRAAVMDLLEDRDGNKQRGLPGVAVPVPPAPGEGFVVGGTPLHAAVVGKQTAAARLLLDRRADLRATLPSGATLLHLAAVQGDIPMLKLLLARGLDVKAKDARGATPLKLAVQAGEDEAAHFLRARGARE